MAIAASYPALRPSLLLDFANSKTVDSRVTFTRSTTAKYYDGVTTAKAEENLLRYSQGFNDGTWSAANATVTANTTAAPDGTTTADTMAVTAGGLSSRVAQVPSGLTGTNTISVFAKAGTKSFIQICDNTNATAFVNFDISTGAVGSTGGGVSGSIVAAGSGWYRCIATFTWLNEISIHIVDSGTAVRREAPATTGDVYLWGAQAEIRSAVTAYTPTTTQPITNYIPVLQTAAAGVPRIDHVPVTGECLGLLIEEQRTNLLLYSEQFDNAWWTKTRSSVITNAVVAPDGTLTAAKLVEDTTASDSHFLNRSSGVIPVGASVVSLYVKSGERSEIAITGSNSAAGGGGTVILNTNTGATVSNSNPSRVIPSFSSVGNGWLRLQVYFDTTVAAQALTFSLSSAGSTIYTGDGYSGIYIWGAQLEAGAFPTSQITTVATQETRNADAASMTGTNFSSWYNADEGTMYAEGTSFAAPTLGFSRVMVRVHGDLASFQIAYVNANSLNMYAAVFSNGVDNGTFRPLLAFNTSYKNALSYGDNLIAAMASAGSLLTTTSGSAVLTKTPASTLYIGANQAGSNIFDGHIKKIAYYPQRLTNANLQALTA